VAAQMDMALGLTPEKEEYQSRLEGERVRKGCGNWPEQDISFRHCL